MDNNFDITELLKTKSFSDLDPDELKFVLGQVENEAEYESLRNIILESRDEIDRASISKDAVMAAFDDEFPDTDNSAKKRTASYWPYLAAAASIIALLVIGSIFLDQDEEQLAEKKPVENKKTEKSQEPGKPEDQTQTREELKEEAQQAASEESISKNQSIEKSDIKDVPTVPKASNNDEIAQLESLEADLEIENTEMNESLSPDKLETPNNQFNDTSSHDYGNLANASAIERSKARTDENKNTSGSSSEFDDIEQSSAEEFSAVPEVVSAQSLEKSTKRSGKSKTRNIFQIKQIKKGHYTSY